MISATETTQQAAEPQEVMRQLALALQTHLSLKADLDEPKVRAIVDEAVAAASLPRPLELHLPDGQVRTLGQRTHRQFEELLALVAEGHANVMLVGPAGTGKTTLVKHVAEALDRPFAFISLSAGVTETHIFGRMLPQADGTWAYVESPFIRCYRTGGVFLFDEVDAADGNVMVSINAALANGMLCNPVNGEIVERHPQCLIVTAANTFGRGGDLVYVGRNALDGATLDRFVLARLFVTYDGQLEESIARSMLEPEPAGQLLAWVRRLRERIAQCRLRRIASTRLVHQAVLAMRAGRTLEEVQQRYLQDWSADERAKLGEGA